MFIAIFNKISPCFVQYQTLWHCYWLFADALCLIHWRANVLKGRDIGREVTVERVVGVYPVPSPVTDGMEGHVYCTVWVNPAPEIFWPFFLNSSEFLVQISHAYYTFLSTLDYKFVFNYLQLWRSYAILSATTIIMCSKCPPSTETHAGWSHLIWHNFVKVVDNWINWIKIRSLS